VKLSTLLEIIGSGSMLLMAGVVAFIFGIANGVAEATHLPMWVCLCGFGALFAIVGIALVDRGAEEAEQQVKAVPPVFDAVRKAAHSPWLGFGASILGGMLLARLFRRERAVVVKTTAPAAPVVLQTAASPFKGDEPVQPAPQPEKRSNGLSRYLKEQLRTLAAEAAPVALAFGIKALGIPSTQQLLEGFLGTDDRRESASPKQSNVPFSDSRDSGEPASASRATRAAPSHNGRTSFSGD